MTTGMYRVIKLQVADTNGDRIAPKVVRQSKRLELRDAVNRRLRETRIIEEAETTDLYVIRIEDDNGAQF